MVKESTNIVYVAQSNGLVLVFSTASGTTNPSLTIDLTAKSTALTCITQDGTTTDLFVGTNGKGIIRFIEIRVDDNHIKLKLLSGVSELL